ncbi:HAMP domain-containing methyl-accepting chemotaxis protein [Azospirillum halopraeferens]|uniref:HAMP domain-containing methyl-accepting chemotaxis protein n=1 Tax=Azospirillum halopraeferens TaxID=34010 RepID=UPI00042481FD|nr:methyl-accepting chemotaxis protein [Azospirillum halopraeferens]
MFRSIRAKLRLTLAALTLLFVVGGVMTVYRQHMLNELLHELDEQVMPAIAATSAVNTATSDYRLAELLSVSSMNAAEVEQAHRDMERLRTEIGALRDRYEPLIVTAEERALYTDFRRQFNEYMRLSERAAVHAREGERVAAMEVLREAVPLFNGFSHALDQLVARNQERGIELAGDADALLNASRMIVGIGVSVVVLLCLLAMRALDRQVSQPLAELSGVARSLAEGRLEAPSASLCARPDEIGDVGRAVAAAADSVRRLTRDLSDLTESAGSGTLSARIDTDGHKGDFAVLVAGANALVTALSRPLHEVAEVMQRVASGDLKGRMAGAYEGELRALKANLNRSLDSLVGLLGELSAVSAELARGNLAVSVSGTYQGEFALLRGNVNQAVEQLREILLSMQVSTQQVAAAATQTAAAARQVFNGASTQTATLAEVVTAIAQAAAAAEAASDNAERGSAVARAAADLAQAGQDELVRLVGMVERVAAAQDRIEQAITRIARIADKTHVLALNAGIEAARAAGEGAGFAIVAREIGRLAEDAAQATQAIESIIGDAALVIRDGVGVAAGTRATMDRLASAAGESGSAVQAIARVMVQQSTAVQQLADQADSLKAGSRDNVAAAEQITATMEELARMVHATKSQIDRFRLA